MPSVSTSLCLREARHADEETVAAREQGDQGLVDHVALAEDHLGDGLAHLRESGSRGFGMRDSCTLRVGLGIAHVIILAAGYGVRAARVAGPEADAYVRIAMCALWARFMLHPGDARATAKRPGRAAGRRTSP